MKWDRARVLKYAQDSTSEDLMDRITVYRPGMEPEAIRLIEAELARRGITQLQIKVHAEARRDAIMLPDGTALQCSFCDRPAVARRWGWHRLWGQLPVFPRRFAFCKVHDRKGDCGQASPG
jgi:hypothetical protein